MNAHHCGIWVTLYLISHWLSLMWYADGAMHRELWCLHMAVQSLQQMLLSFHLSHSSLCRCRSLWLCQIRVFVLCFTKLYQRPTAIWNRAQVWTTGTFFVLSVKTKNRKILTAGEWQHTCRVKGSASHVMLPIWGLLSTMQESVKWSVNAGWLATASGTGKAQIKTYTGEI